MDGDGGEPSVGFVGWTGLVQAVQLRPALEREPLPLPHMGWNDIQPAPHSPLFSGLEADARFYFLHSFYF